VPIVLIKELGFFLVPASRTWDRMISFSSELFRRAVSYAGGNPAATVLAERDRLREPERPLERDPNLEALVGRVNADIARLFGRPAQLKLRLTTAVIALMVFCSTAFFGVQPIGSRAKARNDAESSRRNASSS
jgi:hypothetical protein